MNLNSGRDFAIEIHPTDWRFPTGNSWIAGWIRPSTGQTITDVRARLHHRVILGLAGLPHPVSLRNPPAIPCSPGAGFSFLLSPQQGATLLQLEARDHSGRWSEFFHTAITPAPDAPVPAPPPSLNHSLRRLITVLLKNQLLAPERNLGELADGLIAAHVAEPVNAHPNAPFIGALEEPDDTGRLRYGRISITGWLAHPTARITRISAVIDPLPTVTLPHGLARTDIAGTFPALNGHTDCGFVGEIVLPPGLASPVLLKIFAETDQGENQLVFARRFTPRQPGTIAEIPPLVPGLTFLRAVQALRSSAQSHLLPDSGLIQTMRSAWTIFQTMPVYRQPAALHSKNPSQKKPRARPALAAPTVPAPAHPAPAVVGALPACTLIGASDDMHVSDPAQYFKVGREALTLVQAAVTEAHCGPITAILDLPGGHGRVARWLRTAYPTARLTVCDTQEAGVAFCVEQLGAAGVHATVDGRHWADLPGPYDVIWCGSLLTHFDADEWSNHLDRFAERLSPRGVLVFTSHGLPALERLQTGDKDYGLTPLAVEQLCHATVTTGFGYAAYADSPTYGISMAQPGWLRAFLAAETNLQILSYRPSSWDQHQDVIVCTRRAR